MIEIELKEAVLILSYSDAVHWNDTRVGFAELGGGEDDTIFLQLDDGISDPVFFESAANLRVKVSGSSIFMVNDTGEEVQITPLFSKNLE